MSLYSPYRAYGTTQEKKDITRFKNLLWMYRNYIITNIATEDNIMQTILDVDRAIELLKKGLI